MSVRLFFLLFIFFISWSVSSISSKKYIFEKNQVNILLFEKKENQLSLGINFQLQPGWKIYWQYPGDTGSPPKISLTDTKMKGKVDVQWPIPIELYEPEVELTTRIYKNKILIPFKVLLEKNTYKSDEKIEFLLEFQICEDICIPIETLLKITLPKENYYNFEKASLLTKSEKLVPKPISSSKKFTLKNIIHDKNRLYIEIEHEDKDYKIKNARAFIYNEQIPTLRNLHSSISESKINLVLQSSKNFEINNKETILFLSVDDKSFFTKTKIKKKKEILNISIIYLLLISFFGGLILNLMPCVLPVLGIKLSSFLKLSIIKNKKSIKYASFYLTLGIFFTFMLFAIITICLRFFGLSVGWGMQFQEPSFLFFLLIILIFFTANMFGIINISLSSLSNLLLKKHKKKESLFLDNFFTGIISTLLATPCTAPFVGTAVSIALSQSYYYTILIFFSMAIGMSSPYYLFIIRPECIAFLPKPGIWMKYVKFFFGGLLIFSTIWIGKLLYNHFSEKSIKLNNEILPIQEWEEFSQNKLNQYIKKGYPVFVDITADWCISCQFNKKRVLERKIVLNKMKEKDIKKLKADWTLPNENILNFLKSYNKYGIPFNIIFTKEYPEGFVFNEILNLKDLITKLDAIDP